jgi:hypothetical protein
MQFDGYEGEWNEIAKKKMRGSRTFIMWESEIYRSEGVRIITDVGLNVLFDVESGGSWDDVEEKIKKEAQELVKSVKVELESVSKRAKAREPELIEKMRLTGAIECEEYHEIIKTMLALYSIKHRIEDFLEEKREYRTDEGD